MSHPLIVVEGPDNSGKTTLAHDLAKRINAIYIKVEKHPRFAADVLHYHDILRQATLYAPVVADRHPAISEPIYGTVLRGGHCVRESDQVHCLSQFELVIYCRPRADVILASNDREQMAGVVERLEAIVKAYDQLFTSLIAEDMNPDNLFFYNYQGQGPQAIVDHLLRLGYIKG